MRFTLPRLEAWTSSSAWNWTLEADAFPKYQTSQLPRHRRREHRACQGARRTGHRHRLNSRHAVLRADLLPVPLGPRAHRWEMDNLTRRQNDGIPPLTSTYNIVKRSRLLSITDVNVELDLRLGRTSSKTKPFWVPSY